MPPRRPLTELCIIAVFKQLKPNNQVKASMVSFHCKVLVRAANRRVKTLAITYEDEVDYIKNNVNELSIASKPSMQLTTGEPFFDYPTTNRLSVWNCLNLEPFTPNIEQIVYIFSAVTDLKLIAHEVYNIEPFLGLLNHPQWTGQLINLFCRFDITSAEQSPLPVTAINGLSALEHLAIIFNFETERNLLCWENLTILAQLKIVLVGFGIRISPFLPALERYAIENVDLQVHLLNNDTDSLFSISEPLRSRFVRYGIHSYESGIPYLCSHFSSLTSLMVYCDNLTEIGPIFTAISQLKKLVYLELTLFWREDNPEDPEELPRLLVQLPSVRALDLNMINQWDSHFDLEYLNLSWTLPNCQAIHFNELWCELCKIFVYDHYDFSRLVRSYLFSEILECLRNSAFHKLHRGVHPKKIILGKNISLEQLNITDQ